MSRRPAGRLEEDITAALRRWDGGLPGGEAAVEGAGPTGATVTEIRSAVDEALAYTTLMTTLVRLVNKGVVARERSGRTYRYRLAEGGNSLVAATTARRMHGLLARSPDRNGALASFVAGLDDDDEARLTALLQSLHGHGAGTVRGGEAVEGAEPVEGLERFDDALPVEGAGRAMDVHGEQPRPPGSGRPGP